ncbi:MAG TPA: ribonuclease III [Candidatus Manganitrophaceae bacterium]|nr:ribonuclease III [Candidatus Manganitrophaceae bacterium]
MTPKDLSVLQKRLSYFFAEPKRLRQALTHKSYLNESKDKEVKDNERLEFLGDAVLDLIISEALIRRFPDSPEGDLSKLKAKVVSEGTLARVAKEIDLGSFLFLGKGEEITFGREKHSLLADALEAVIAAIYLDRGFSAAREVVLKEFDLPLRETDRPNQSFDYKTELQEHCQEVFEALPVYQVIQESGPDHQKIFEVEIRIRGELFGAGAGKSKKEAEQKAARAALEQLRKERGGR